MSVTWQFSPGTNGSLSGLSDIFVSSACLLMRMTMVDKSKAVVCCLLATLFIMLSEKKKRKCKMWYLERDISCDTHLLNELLETDVEFECLGMIPSWFRQLN
jgi:hypothetical protein